jgi:hypothetical protein
MEAIQIPGNSVSGAPDAAAASWPPVVVGEARAAAVDSTTTPLWKEIGVSGVSVSIANTVTNPLGACFVYDVMKQLGERSRANWGKKEMARVPVQPPPARATYTPTPHQRR